MKVFRKILLTALILGGIVIIAAIILGRQFEEEITQYVVGGINKQIRAEVNVEDIRLSFIKKFPDATVELQEVLIRSVPDYNISEFDNQTDTLLFTERLYLRFNVFKILKQEYYLREVHASGGIMNILTDRQGNTNYIIMNTGKREKEGDFLLEFDNVKFSNIRINYINRALDIDVKSDARKLFMKGQFSKQEYVLNCGLDGNVLEYTNEGIVFLRDKKLVADASLFITPEIIDIENGSLQLGGQKLSISGDVLKGDPLLFKLSLTGEQLQVGEVIRYLASFNEKWPVGLDAGGLFSFDASIHGAGSRTKMPLIAANFTIRDGWIRSGKLTQEITAFKTDGRYSNGSKQAPSTTLIEMNNTSMIYGNSRLGGDYSVKNLLHPEIHHKIKLELDLTDLQELLTSNSRVKNLEGFIHSEIETSGSLTSIFKFSKKDLLGLDYNGRIRFDNAGFMTDSILICRNLNGEMSYMDYLNIETVSALLSDNYLSCTGRADNIKEFIFTDHGNLWMDLDVYSEKADLNPVFGMSGENTKRPRKDTIQLPGRIYLKSRFWFDKMEYRNFSAENVMGDLVYKPRRITVNNLTLSSMQGLITAGVMLEQQKDHQFMTKVISDVSKIDIKELFTSFNNFGQKFIMDKHLNGRLSGKVNFSSGLDNSMKINKEEILTDCDIVIKDGALVDFEPMQKLSRFIDVQELEEVTFSTLTNQIFIRNSEVLIPKMDIQSSAFDISGSGIHGFDKHFEYKVRVSLSELLSGKVKEPDKQAMEFGAIEDDGLGRVYINLIIEGSPGEVNIKYDRTGAIQNIRNQLRDEKQEIKEILNEELGLFKRDSALHEVQGEQKTPDFIIEWEEDQGGDSIIAGGLKPDNKSDDPRFIITWDDEDEEEQDQVNERTVRKKRKRRDKN